MFSVARLRFLVAVAPLGRWVHVPTRGRIPGRTLGLPSFNPAVCGACLSLGLLLIPLGAMVSAEDGPTSHSAADSQSKHSVHAIPLPTTRVDGQSSWIIEPDVPRIPNVPGMDCRLPPHIERRLSYAFDLAQRGATYSANAEFRAVLSQCALELDAREGGTSRREALYQAWRAVDEADDFNGDRIELWGAEDVRNIVAGHETPVLHQAEVPATDAVQAVQAYYAFAERRFTDACRGLPGTSLAFYGLARTFVVPGTQVAQAAGKAALLQRVALAIAPQNVLAGNELGVLLAEHGQLDGAQRLFRQCLATNPTPETWRNLAVVYARQGNRAASQAALASADALAANCPASDVSPRHSPRDGSEDDTQSTEGTKKGIFAKFNLSKLRSPFWR
jgi:tetratricopeptide (TPR) repeat protein